MVRVLFTVAAIAAALDLCGTAAIADAAVARRVLLTTFDPFGGSTKNNSQEIGRELIKLLAQTGSVLSVKLCNLPVVYDEAAVRAMECVADTKPDWVVSLGEAACELKIETAANNLDDTPGFPDNAGQIRAGSEILPGSPERLGFSFSVPAMLCHARSKSWRGVALSTSPGNFVCNNLAYHLTRGLKETGTPFTFIHVPNSRCGRFARNPVMLARRIAEMLEASVAYESAGHAIQAERLPVDHAEASLYLKRARAVDAASCDSLFAEELLGEYSAISK